MSVSIKSGINVSLNPKETSPTRPRPVCLKGERIFVPAMFPLVIVTAPVDAVVFACGWMRDFESFRASLNSSQN